MLHNEGGEAPAEGGLAAEELGGESRVEPAVLLRVELAQCTMQRRHKLARQLRRPSAARRAGARRGRAGGGCGRLAVGPLAAAGLVRVMGLWGYGVVGLWGYGVRGYGLGVRVRVR